MQQSRQHLLKTAETLTSLLAKPNLLCSDYSISTTGQSTQRIFAMHYEDLANIVVKVPISFILARSPNGKGVMKFTWLSLFLIALCLSTVQANAWQEDSHPRSPSSPEHTRKANLPPIELAYTSLDIPAIRDARSSVFTNGGPLLSLDSVRAFHFTFHVDVRGMSELPTADEGIDMVLYGEVTKSQVFMNARKRGLYTEYTVKVGRTLKPSDEFAPGSEVAILRVGGLGRLPSGGTIEHEVQGYGPEPTVGSQYLFFLKRLPDPANAFTYFKFWHVLPQADTDPVVKAAFDEDLARVQKKESAIDGKPLPDVSKKILAGQ